MIGRLFDILGAIRRLPRVLRLTDGRAYVLLSPQDVTVNLEGPNIHLESEDGRSYRSRVALELLDPDVYGFMLLLLRSTGPRPEINLRAQTEPEWVDAFTAGMAQVTLALVD